MLNEAAWKALLATLKVRGVPHPIRAAALNSYERDTGFLLPDSYRSFCRVFGAGKVGDWYSVAVPKFEGNPRIRNFYDLAALTAFFHTRVEWAEYAADPQQFERAVIFATDDSGAMFFWDPLLVTTPEAHETAIFVIWRDWTQERVSDTFADFVNICLHRGARTLYDEPPEIGFRSATTSRGAGKGVKANK